MTMTRNWIVLDWNQKEIGTQKGLGASSSLILKSLLKEYILLVVIANLVAWPPAIYFVSLCLNTFAYRVSMSPWVFVISGALAFGIAILSVAWHTVRAATANPIESLRYE